MKGLPTVEQTVPGKALPPKAAAPASLLLLLVPTASEAIPGACGSGQRTGLEGAEERCQAAVHLVPGRGQRDPGQAGDRSSAGLLHRGPPSACGGGWGGTQQVGHVGAGPWLLWWTMDCPHPQWT